jgi:anti-sigma-K factor RskA
MEIKVRFDGSECGGYESLIEDYLSGELVGSEARNTLEHLKVCAACRALLAEARGSVVLLRAEDPTPDPGHAFARNVMARINSDLRKVSEVAGLWQPFVTVAWRFAASATLALGLLLAYAATSSTTPTAQPASSEIAQADFHELFPEPAAPPSSPDEILMMVAETGHADQQ